MEGDVVCRLDKAPSKLQHWRMYDAVSNIYKLQQGPDDLVGAPLDVLTFLFNHRAIDKKDRTRANEVENTRKGSSPLLSKKEPPSRPRL
eukprot:6737248-Pyramimonas_sp.AAC.1